MIPKRLAKSLVKDKRVVLLLGAGVHHAASIKKAKGNLITQQLASWEGVQEGFHDGNLLGQTLAWELNGIDGHDDDAQAAARLREHQKSLSMKLQALSKKAEAFSWQPPTALQTFLKSGRVSDVISLNVDLLLENWLLDACQLKTLPRVKGANNSCRRREFKLGSVVINFWYPHGDVDKFRSLQFSLSDYAKSLNWMEQARRAYKAREDEGTDAGFETWFDLFLSKREIVVLGASLDQAEWDIWYALLCRWRNFSRFESEDWCPSVWVLTQKGEAKHRHLPTGYVKLLEGVTYQQAWDSLENVAQGLLAGSSVHANAYE